MSEEIQSEEIIVYEAQPLAPSQPLAQNLVALLLEDKRSEDTKKAYASDLAFFFGAGYTPEQVRAFCALSVPNIALALGSYKSAMRDKKLSEATINRRLAAVRSLLKFAHRLGYCVTDGRGLVEGEKTKSYRDTRGVDVATLRKLLAAPSKKYAPLPVNTGKHINICLPVEYIRAREKQRELHRLRDTAILHLLIENALRRAEVCKLNVGDFDSSSRSLWILGKGRGNQKERLTISIDTTLALTAYLAAAGHGADITSALFRNLDPRPECAGQRLTADGLYGIVGEYGAFVGLKRLTPHQLRHSAITAALEATGGDVRKVQKLSRHAKLDTLLIYDDNRSDVQGEMSSLLSGLMSGKKKSRAH